MRLRFLFARVAVWLLLMFSGPSVALSQQMGQGAQAVLQNGDVLSLSASQQEEIREIMSKTVRRYQEVATANRGASDLSEKLAAVRKRGQKEALGVLSAVQRQLWDDMNSEPVSRSREEDDEIAKRSLTIPSIEEMKNPPSPGAFGPSAEITKTSPHPSLGDDYVVLTDHADAVALEALEKLATHRDGQVIRVNSLVDFYKDSSKASLLQKRLVQLEPRYVAVAPRLESYRENLHLFVLRLLSSLDSDPELDVFPGYLMASDAENLAALVERTIQFKPIEEESFAPVSIGAIEDTNSLRYRSYQKAKVIQKMFAEDGLESEAIIVTTRKSHTERGDFPDLSENEVNIAMLPSSERYTFREFSPAAKVALSDNNLLFMFGHGTTDRICGTKVSAYADISFLNEVVFCGSCMSASPYSGDRIDLDSKKDEKRFAFHAMDNGAVMLLGHMGLCGGFPKVYPMAELVLDGYSAGEAYQRLMNGILKGRGVPPYYPEPAPGEASESDPANALLYVLFGDPALVPVAR